MAWKPPPVTTEQRGPVLQTAKVAIATVAAWVVGETLFRQELPVFGAIAALLVVQPSVNQSLRKALERSLGVVLGVALAYLLGVTFPVGAYTWVVLVAIVLAVFLAWGLRLAPGASTQIVVSVLLVLTVGAADSQYAVDRILETLVGAAIGFVVNLVIVPPVRLDPARDAVLALGDELAASLGRLAYALQHPQSAVELEAMLVAARHNRQLAATAAAALEEADESLTLNPRRSSVRAAIGEQHALFARVNPVVNRVVGMSRTVHDHWDVGLLAEPTVAAIAEDLERAAHDLRLVLREHAGEAPATDTAAMPALTSPVRVVEPHPQHWMLIGALLEDLRRVREEIIGADE